MDDKAGRTGVVVADGYDIRIRVRLGRLQVESGVGADRSVRQFHRATSGLKRLVILSASGVLSLEALRWLADIRASILQVDRNGRVIAAYGPPGTDRPALRRAQAIAIQTDQALVLSRWLVDAKLAGQVDTLRRFAKRVEVDEPIAVIEAYRQAAAEARMPDDLRSCEAWAAGAYWQALAPLEVRFAQRDADRVPSHWRTFGGRSSPIASGPRMAANPANATINYLAALLESESTLAARIVGLDPGLGVMHTDQAHRDSLAADLMEAVRPLVEAYAFELLTSRPFAARDFHETRAGVCRLTAPLTHELAQTLPRWRELVGRVAEDLAAALESPTVPTPITGRRRAARRPGGARSKAKAGPAKDGRCSWCGAPTERRRKTCSNACMERVMSQTHKQFAKASSEWQRRTDRTAHPALTEDANRKRSATRKRQREAELTWEREHPGPVDYEWFTRDVIPTLAGFSTGELARMTGMSVAHCAKVKRGERIPHPRWWEILLSARDHARDE